MLYKHVARPQVAALKDYKEKFPGLFEALRTRKADNKKDSGWIFSQRDQQFPKISIREEKKVLKQTRSLKA